MNKVESTLEHWVFLSRWLLAPFFIGLLLAIAALLLIIGFSGYENFVSKIGTGEHEDRPAWMGRVGFSDLKIKLMGAIVAISAVELLKAFINVSETTPWQTLAWKVGIHVTFV